MGIGPHQFASERTTDEARNARTEGEQALVDDPEAARQALMAAQAHGGPGLERLMELSWRSAWIAWSRRDWELTTLFLDEGHVFNAGAGGELPGVGSRIVGVEGWLRSQETLLDAWADLTLSLDRIVACEAERVTLSMRWVGTGRASGVDIDQLGLCRSTFDAGAVVEQTYWFNHDAGMNALGIDGP